MGEENINNNGCDQFTRPEEILELQKYLRAIKEELAERTELGTDVIQMDSSYRAGEIDLDRSISSTGRIATNMNPESERIDFSNAILGVPLEGFPEEPELGGDLEKINREGHRDINKLPDTIDTINVERIERLEKVREKLVGADTNSPRELETYVEKLDVVPERINLGNELEKIIGETKDINLSQERVDLVEPKFIDSLGTEKEKIKGEIPELTLGEGRDRIPFLETKIDQLPNDKEPLKSNQGISQEKIELSNAQSPLPEDRGMMFDPTQEDLPDAVLGIPGELDDIELGDVREDLPREGEIKDLSLSDFLDRIKGEDKDLSQLPREITSGGNIPQGQKEINKLGKTIPNNGLITGENNLPDSLDSFLTGQGIIPGSLEDIERLNTDLPEDSYIEGELKNPNLHDNLPENGYIEGEQKNPNLTNSLPDGSYIKGEQKNLNLSSKLPEGGYIEGELKNLNLQDKLSEDGYIEGELKNPNLQDKLPEDGYIEGELKNPNLLKELPEEGYVEGELKNPNVYHDLPEDGYIDGEQKNPNFHTELPEDSYVTGEFENIDELRTKLPKDGHTKGEFEDIDKLRTKLSKDGRTKGEFEDIDKLRTKLSKDGKVRGEFEDIDELARRLPKKDGYTKGDFKKIKNLTTELPDPDGYPSGSFKEVEKLTKHLPEDGYLDGDFVDLGEELTEELPIDGYITGDFKEIKELTEELPIDGYTQGDIEEIKKLPDELPKDSLLDEEDLVEISKLTKHLPEEGKITEGKFRYIEGLEEKISPDGKIDGDFKGIEELKETLPEGGFIDGDFHSITDLPDELPKDGRMIEGEGKEIKKLTKDLPIDSYIDGDFKDVRLNDKLPKDGHIGEEGIVEIDKLTKKLPEDGYTQGNLVEFEELNKELPKDGHIEKGGIVEIDKLTKKLPEDGHIGEEGIVNFDGLTKELPEDGHIGEEGIVEIENLNRELPVDGNIPGELEDIYELDASLPFDGRTSGDFKEIDSLTKELPNPDGYTQGDLVDISELDKALSDDGLIHGGEEGPFSEEEETENLYQYYSSNKEKFSVEGGTIPGSVLPEGDDWEHVSPEGRFYQYTGKSGGIYIDPVTREVKYDGDFQIPDGVIAKDTYSSSDPRGREGLLSRHPLELDNKEFDEIGGLIPDTEIPRGDTWEHRDGNELDNKKFDEIGGLIPGTTIPNGDDWKHTTPEERINFYNKSKIREKSVDPKTKEREYKGEFIIEEGIVPDSKIPEGDIWEHEDFEKQFKLYQDSAVRIESVDAEGNIKYKGEFKFDEGVIPENSRPKNDVDPKLYEWLLSLEKIDAGAGDLYHALLARAGHNLDGYYTYLMHYADKKDLTSGWATKISGILSSLGIGEGSAIDIDKYKEFEKEIADTAMKYYAKEGKIRIEQSHLPRGLESFMGSSGYLRYMADLVRSGYSSLGIDTAVSGAVKNVYDKLGLEKTGTIWSKMQGSLGLQETMLDKILMELVKLRDKAERSTKANRDRLPGGTGVIEEMIMDADVCKAASTLGKTFIDKVKSNIVGSTHGDTTNPINRPVTSYAYEINRDKGNSYDIYGRNTTTVGWYDPYGENTGKSALSGWDLVKASVKDTFSKTGGQEINYRFDTNYLQGVGIGVTLYDLAERNIDFGGKIESVEGLMEVIRRSPLITEPSKFLTTNNIGNRTTTTLDTNNYWEIVIEPYLGLDNGFCSYLPCIDEINIMNFYTHGVKTLYSRWIPIVSFDLSRSRTTTKSIGLFGGEFTIPGGIEYSNELRFTVIDDVYKSWRRYFEKCADVGVYNSRIHKKEFYGYEDPYSQKPNVKSPGEWKNYKITQKDAEKITVVDKNAFVLAPYKNITFRIRIYIMTPQYSTINKYDLLATLKEISIERSGEIDPGSQDLELTFSIVGETDESNLKFPTPKKSVSYAGDEKRWNEQLDADQKSWESDQAKKTAEKNNKTGKKTGKTNKGSKSNKVSTKRSNTKRGTSKSNKTGKRRK